MISFYLLLTFLASTEIGGIEGPPIFFLLQKTCYLESRDLTCIMSSVTCIYTSSWLFYHVFFLCTKRMVILQTFASLRRRPIWVHRPCRPQARRNFYCEIDVLAADFSNKFNCSIRVLINALL